MKSSKYVYKFILFISLVIATGVFVSHDYFLYSRPIATVTSSSSVETETQKGFDGSKEYTEVYYKQTIFAQLRNSDDKGRYVTLTNNYTSSSVYDTEYEEGDDIFVESIEADKDGHLIGNVGGLKRDYYVILILTIFVGLFLIIGGKEGALTIVSMTLNLVAFYFVLLLYLRGYNMLVMTIPLVIFFTGMLLFFMYGKNEKTILSFAATFCSVLVTATISAIVMVFSDRIDYDFMDYLIQPYEQMDANYIFLSEILIGTMGAVMDVVVTVVMTVNQIVETSHHAGRRELIASCRTVGDDLIGTMIPVIFFTNIAASLPFFILGMRNGILLSTILKHNVFFEMARFLTGSIGIVLAIPITAGISIWYYRRKVEKC